MGAKGVGEADAHTARAVAREAVEVDDEKVAARARVDLGAPAEAQDATVVRVEAGLEVRVPGETAGGPGDGHSADVELEAGAVSSEVRVDRKGAIREVDVPDLEPDLGLGGCHGAEEGEEEEGSDVHVFNLQWDRGRLYSGYDVDGIVWVPHDPHAPRNRPHRP